MRRCSVRRANLLLALLGAARGVGPGVVRRSRAGAVVRAGDVLCTGQVRLACVDVDTLKPKAMPKTLVGET